MKDLNYYMSLNYPVTVDQFLDDDGKKKYVVEITDLPGCSSHAEELDEAFAKLQIAKEAWLEVSLSRGLEVPEPVSEDKFSGKFLLRVPAKLHKQLATRAGKEGLSLNQLIRSALEKYLDNDLIASRIEKAVQLMQEACNSIRAINTANTIYVTNIPHHAPLVTFEEGFAGSAGYSVYPEEKKYFKSEWNTSNVMSVAAKSPGTIN